MTKKEFNPSADNWHSVQAEIVNIHTKSTIMVNGGAIIALLAFLQKIWGEQNELSRIILYSIMVLSIGVFSGGITNWLRYETSIRYQYKSANRQKWARLSNFVQILPVFCFLIAAFIVAIGALRLIE